MAPIEEFKAAMDRYHLAAAEFVRGNPEPYKAMFSHAEDVTLGNPFGPFSRGWREAEATMDRAATFYQDGEVIDFETIAETVTSELAYVVEVERFRARMGGQEHAGNVSLRTTSVLRPENGSWKVVHRHADPITTVRPAASVLHD
jgi:ketosteroid isomerase-like protein